MAVPVAVAMSAMAVMAGAERFREKLMGKNPGDWGQW